MTPCDALFEHAVEMIQYCTRLPHPCRHPTPRSYAPNHQLSQSRRRGRRYIPRWNWSEDRSSWQTNTTYCYKYKGMVAPNAFVGGGNEAHASYHRRRAPPPDPPRHMSRTGVGDVHHHRGAWCRGSRWETGCPASTSRSVIPSQIPRCRLWNCPRFRPSYL